MRPNIQIEITDRRNRNNHRDLPRHLRPPESRKRSNPNRENRTRIGPGPTPLPQRSWILRPRGPAGASGSLWSPASAPRQRTAPRRTGGGWSPGPRLVAENSLQGPWPPSGAGWVGGSDRTPPPKGGGVPPPCRCPPPPLFSSCGISGPCSAPRDPLLTHQGPLPCGRAASCRVPPNDPCGFDSCLAFDFARAPPPPRRSLSSGNRNGWG